MTDQPTIVIAGDAPWLKDFAAPDGFASQQITTTDRYVATLTNIGAALVLVAGDSADWQHYTAAPKSSPATRRVPVIVIAASDDVRASAATYGADGAVSPVALLADTRSLVVDYATVPDPAVREQLECECEEPLPPLAVQGIEKFNAGEFYPQHDLFEEQWMETKGPVRDLYRAVLQVGVAYYQVERGNYRGARKMLLRAVQWLEALPDVCQTINVAQLREDAYRVRDELERTDPDDIGNFDRSLLKPVQRVAE